MLFKNDNILMIMIRITIIGLLQFIIFTLTFSMSSTVKVSKHPVCVHSQRYEKKTILMPETQNMLDTKTVQSELVCSSPFQFVQWIMWDSMQLMGSFQKFQKRKKVYWFLEQFLLIPVITNQYLLPISSELLLGCREGLSVFMGMIGRFSETSYLLLKTFFQ